ncbi:MAG: TldD/PmbA family protein [Candidatus Aenigmatarchaeota archaeon]|mgnify:CR=1 FL=1
MHDIAEKVVSMASGCDYADVRIENVTGDSIILKNGDPITVGVTRNTGMCIRILVKGSLGISFTNDFSNKAMKEAVDRAVKLAKSSAEIVKNPLRMSKETPIKDKFLVKEEKKLSDVTIEEKMEELISLDKTLVSTNLNFSTRFFDLSTECREKYYCNSEGSRIYSYVPRVGLFCLVAVKSTEVEQRMEHFGNTGGWEFFRKWDLENKLVEESKILAKIPGMPSMKKERMSVVLSPELVGIASHESCGHPYEADRILGREAANAGGSFVTKKSIGTRIGSNVVNLVDDPTVKNSFGFYLYDDEGVKARKRYLIKKGMINELLQNRETAAEFRIKSNASSRANSWAAEPIVRMANTFVEPGNCTFDEIIDVKKGVYIKSYMEWNIDDKRFNQRYVGLEAYEIKNGSLEGLVKRPALEITTPAFWSAVDAVGKDFELTVGNCGKGEPMQGIPVGFGGPHIRLQNVMLG